MSIYCPLVNRNVIYQFCEDCTDRLCRDPRGNDQKERTKNEGTYERSKNEISESGSNQQGTV